MGFDFRWIGDERHHWTADELEQKEKMLRALSAAKLEPWQEQFLAGLKDAAAGELLHAQLYGAGRSRARWEWRIREAANFALSAMREGSATMTIVGASPNASAAFEVEAFDRTLHDLLEATGWSYSLTRDELARPGVVSLLLVVSSAAG